jgi:hypothetical protein
MQVQRVNALSISPNLSKKSDKELSIKIRILRPVLKSSTDGPHFYVQRFGKIKITCTPLEFLDLRPIKKEQQEVGNEHKDLFAFEFGDRMGPRTHGLLFGTLYGRSSVLSGLNHPSSHELSGRRQRSICTFGLPGYDA